MKWISDLKSLKRVGVFVPMIKLKTLGDLIKDMENSQNEVDTKNLNFQHTYLDARFSDMKFQAKPKKETRRN